MKNFIILAVMALVLTGCASNKNYVTSGDVVGLNARDSKIVDFHTRIGRELGEKKVGALNAASGYEKTLSEIYSLKSDFKQAIADRNRQSSLLLQQNNDDKNSLLMLQKYEAQVMVKKSKLDMYVEDLNRKISDNQQDTRTLNDESSVTGQEVPFDGETVMPPVPYNVSEQENQIWLNKIQPQVTGINRFKNVQ